MKPCELSITCSVAWKKGWLKFFCSWYAKKCCSLPKNTKKVPYDCRFNIKLVALVTQNYNYFHQGKVSILSKWLSNIRNKRFITLPLINDKKIFVILFIFTLHDMFVNRVIIHLKIFRHIIVHNRYIISNAMQNNFQCSSSAK